MIGDADPEDAYDAGDPVDVRLALIAWAIESARTDALRGYLRRLGIARLLRDIAREVEHG